MTDCPATAAAAGRPAGEGALSLRDAVLPADIAHVRAIVGSTGKFNDEEIAVSAELVEERLAKGPASGYEFLFADSKSGCVGYVCYGRILGTQSSFDLYWIAVDVRQQGRGLGRRLLAEAERRIAAQGGERVYIETSSRSDYAPTRAFYQRMGYQLEATLAEFYGPGDDKLILVKRLPKPAEPT